MSIPEWNEYCGWPSFRMSWRGSSNEPRIACWRSNGFTGHPYAYAAARSANAAASSLPRRARIDAVLTTSPPGSVHLVGAAVKRTLGIPWLADLRDSLLAHPHRRHESAAVRAKERATALVARTVARYADAIVAASDAIAEEARTLAPRG